MSQMIPFDHNGPAQLPVHLQGQNLGVSAGLLEVMGNIGNRIGLKGSRFRLVVGGKEEAVLETTYIDVHVLGVVPYYSRIYYEKNYKEGENAAPTCFSEDGKAPPQDLATKQSTKCETCPQNQKGSKTVDGVKMKACGYFQRLIVAVVGDAEMRVFKLDVKSQGLFGDGQPAVNKFNLREYAKYISNRGADVATLVTRISFDTDASVAKLLFSPVGYVTAEQFEQIKVAVNSEEVKNLLKIDMNTVDLSGEVAADESPAVEPTTPAAPVVQQQPPVVEQAPAVQAAPAPPAPAKKKYVPVKAKLGAFDLQKDFLDQGWTKEQLLQEGYIEEYVEPVAAPPAPPAPPKPPAPPAPPKPPAPPAGAVQVEDVPAPTRTAPVAPTRPAVAPTAAPAAVTETVSDAELDDIISGLT